MSEAFSREEYVTIFRSYDVIFAQMLEEMLQKNGFAARLLGTRNGPLFGVPQIAFEVRIEVPATQEEEATAFVRAFTEAPPLAEDEAREGENEEEQDDPLAAR